MTLSLNFHQAPEAHLRWESYDTICTTRLLAWHSLILLSQPGLDSAQAGYNTISWERCVSPIAFNLSCLRMAQTGTPLSPKSQGRYVSLRHNNNFFIVHWGFWFWFVFIKCLHVVWCKGIPLHWWYVCRGSVFGSESRCADERSHNQAFAHKVWGQTIAILIKLFTTNVSIKF